MPLSQAKLTIQDGNLGQAVATGDQVQVKLGVCTAGVANTPTLVTSPNTARSLFGGGPLVEATIAALAVPGCGGVIMVKVPGTVAGSIGTIAPGTGNTGTGTYTVTGTPNDAYDVVVQLTAGGTNLAAGTAAFVVSIDGGDSFSSPLAVPTGGTYAIPGTGLNVVFANGTGGASFVAGDTAAVSTVAPGYSTNDLLTALDAAAAYSGTVDFFMVHAVGQAASVGAALAVASAMSTKLVSYTSSSKFFRGVVELPHDTDANVLAAVVAVIAPRMMVVGDFTELSELDGTQRRRHAAWSVMARAGAVRAAEDLGRVKSGALANVKAVYRDEQVTPGLQDARVTVLRTVPGKIGYYVAAPVMLEAPGSDYRLLQYGRVIDIAAKVIQANATDLLRDDLDLNPDGTIAEDAAKSIERTLVDALNAAIVEKKNGVACSAHIDRTVNLITSPTVNIDYGVTPRAYAEQLVQTLSLKNPAAQ